MTNEVGLSKTEIYKRIRQGRFPKSHRESHKVAYWLKHEIDLWLQVGEEAWSLL